MGSRRITGPACAKYRVIANVAPAGRGAPGGTVRVASAGGAGPPASHPDGVYFQAE